MSFFVDFDDKELLLFERTLRRLTRNGIPVATRNTINIAAERTQKRAKFRELPRKMILRNKFTQGSIRVRKARGNRISRQAAEVGSLQQYLADQEFGSVKREPGLPTTVASGEGRGARPRRRLPRRAQSAKQIQLGKKERFPHARNRKALNAAKIHRAQRQRKKHVYLEFAKSEGLFRITRRKLDLVVETSHTVARIPPNPWLHPATMHVAPQQRAIYRTQIIKQLQRHSLWKRS